jgi:hypothetical protein
MVSQALSRSVELLRLVVTADVRSDMLSRAPRAEDGRPWASDELDQREESSDDERPEGSSRGQTLPWRACDVNCQRASRSAFRDSFALSESRTCFRLRRPIDGDDRFVTEGLCTRVSLYGSILLLEGTPRRARPERGWMAAGTS